ncbi:MAG TPA: class I SAM-dependent methyltransferase [Gaiellaceae bacterium]|nr:class I SAM-dependent methyltransferase [Gaiellaceae bacterium]
MARKTDLYYTESDGARPTSFADRWSDLDRVADLRPGDRVLDVGCAEGLISLEVATRVAHVDAFDVSGVRIAEARRLAEQRGIGNASFATGSIDTFPLEPLSYDVALFLSVWGKRLDADRTVGAGHLARILGATRRQLLMRAGVQRKPRKQAWLAEILEVCDREGFDALCFSRTRQGEPSRTNLIVANRRGSDARSGELPALALVPTALLAGHPVVAAARRS